MREVKSLSTRLSRQSPVVPTAGGSDFPVLTEAARTRKKHNIETGAYMTASPKDQNGATDLSATVRQKIINDCGALMVRRPPLDTRIKDVSALPHPKEQILDALLLEIVRGRSQHIDNMMYVGMLLQSVLRSTSLA